MNGFYFLDMHMALENCSFQGMSRPPPQKKNYNSFVSSYRCNDYITTSN